MMRSWLNAWGCFLLTAGLSSSAWGAAPPQPGTINYIEGQASIDGQALTSKSVGSAVLAAGQSLSTRDGRAEILLTPGVFFRVGDNSTVRMVSPGLADTVVAVDKGRAMVEVADIHRENNIVVRQGAASVRLLKAGLYDFDADRQQVRVFDGKAAVRDDDRQADVKGGRQLALNTAGKLKAHKFDKKAGEEDELYRWASLRSAYLAEANVAAARTYAGGSGWAPGMWYGAGWYWSPWYGAYTFIPADGIFFDPFGWGYYSPWMVYGAPYYGLGYYRHFGPGYRPPIYRSPRGFALGGHAYTVPRGRIGGFSRGAAPAGRIGGFGRVGRGFGGARGGGFHGGRR
jgi:hypothetical protein